MTPLTLETVARQLQDELAGLAATWTPILGPDRGIDLERAAGQTARQIARSLVEGDDHESAQTCIDVLNVLWPHGTPETIGHPDWWHTPLGRACARSLGHDTAETVSRSVAAAMLGVTPGTVSQLVHRGTLDRHPDGGVLRSSVLARLAR